MLKATILRLSEFISRVLLIRGRRSSLLAPRFSALNYAQWQIHFPQIQQEQSVTSLPGFREPGIESLLNDGGEPISLYLPLFSRFDFSSSSFFLVTRLLGIWFAFPSAHPAAPLFLNCPYTSFLSCSIQKHCNSFGSSQPQSAGVLKSRRDEGLSAARGGHGGESICCYVSSMTTMPFSHAYTQQLSYTLSNERLESSSTTFEIEISSSSCLYTSFPCTMSKKLTHNASACKKLCQLLS